MQDIADDHFLSSLGQGLGAIPEPLWKAALAFIGVWAVVRVALAVLGWGDRQRDAYRRLDAAAYKKTRAWRALTRRRFGRLLPRAIAVDEQSAPDLPFKTLCLFGDILIATRGRHASAADAGAANRAYRIIQAEVIFRRVEWARTHDPITNLADAIRAAILRRLEDRR